jgi:hypothetical protein
MLTDEDLEQLEFWELGFWIGGVRRMKKLFLVSELERVALEKWGAGFEEEVISFQFGNKHVSFSYLMLFPKAKSAFRTNGANPGAKSRGGQRTGGTC